MPRLWTTSPHALRLRRLLARPALRALERGATLRRAARLVGVHVATLCRWRVADAGLDLQFRAAFATGKAGRKRLAAA